MVIWKNTAPPRLGGYSIFGYTKDLLLLLLAAAVAWIFLRCLFSLFFSFFFFFLSLRRRLYTLSSVKRTL